MKQDNKAKVDRRDLLRVLGVGAGAAIAPAALVPEAHANSEMRSSRRTCFVLHYNQQMPMAFETTISLKT